MAKYIATLNILVDLGESHLELSRGQKVDEKEIPAGSLDTMLRLGQLVKPEAYVDLPPKSEGPDTSSDKKLTPIDKLGLDDKIVKTLAAAKLTTVAEVLAYGSTKGNLLGVKGIDEPTEDAIQKAIAAALA